VSSEKKQNKTDLLRMALTLFLICSFVAALLALANYYTAPIIKKTAEKQLNDSLKSLMVNAAEFETMPAATALVEQSVPVLAVYKAKDAAGLEIGYCVHVAPIGYSDTIEMLVAIDGEGAVSGVKILSISDTPGVGMKVQSDEAFQKSLIGRTEPATVVKEAPADQTQVQGISGATISSTAYVEGVNTAIETVRFLTAGEVAK
jgi:electron transport complex protein RnfG